MSLPHSALALPPLAGRLRRVVAESIEWFRALQSPHGNACPRCLCKALRRSRIRWYEAWRKALPTRPFRCEACCHRTWLRPEEVEVMDPCGVTLHESAMGPADDREMDLTLLDEGPGAVAPASRAAAYPSEPHADWQVRALVRALEDRLSELRAAGRSLPVQLDPVAPTLARLTTSREVRPRIRRTER